MTHTKLCESTKLAFESELKMDLLVHEYHLIFCAKCSSTCYVQRMRSQGRSIFVLNLVASSKILLLEYLQILSSHQSHQGPPELLISFSHS